MPLEQIAGMGGGLRDITGSLTDLVGLFADKNTSQSTRVSQQGMDYLLQRILESGYADVTSGKRRAGLYDSSTDQLLVDDFLARAAGEVASRNTTTSMNQQAPLGGLLGGGGGLLGGLLTGGMSLLTGGGLFGGGGGIVGDVLGGIGDAVDDVFGGLF